VRRLLAGALCGFVLVAGCATTANVHESEGKALAVAWSGLDAIALTLDTLRNAGKLGTNASAVAATDLGKARDALDAATTAYQSNNDASAQANVATATALIAELVTIATDNGGSPSPAAVAAAKGS